MPDIEAMKAALRKLSARAMQSKMDLHDLSEELPRNWQQIPELARRAHEAFAELDRRRAELDQAEAVRAAAPPYTDPGVDQRGGHGRDDP